MRRDSPISVRIGRAARGVAVAGTLALAACAPGPDPEALRFDGVVERMRVTAPGIASRPGPSCGSERLDPGQKGAGAPARAPGYRIGPGDTLRLNIFGEEGLSDITARVDAEGFVQLPIIELVQVAGQSTRTLQRDLKQRYSVHFVDPWVTVEVADAASSPIYFLGEFRDPGVRYMQGATNLLEALALAGGMEEDAYLPGARLLRDDTVCTVDLQALLRGGRFDQNVWIAPRDVIYAPRREDMSVYVLGAVGAPQSVAFGAEGRTLMQALSLAGGATQGEARLREVRIIRSFSPTSGELIVADVQKMLTGRGLDFPLQPGDVVFVPRSAIADWNGALAQVLPSLQVLGGVLTPITLIEALRE